MKFNLRHVLIFLLLLALSIGFGFGFDAVATAIEKHDHPRPEALAASVSENAERFGIPEAVLWATIKNGSGFASNAVSESGEIGLMQLTPEQFTFICAELLNEDAKDAGMLYDPETNLRAGSAWLSYLYGRYGVWEHVYVAYRLGTETVDAYLADPANLSELGVLCKYPSAESEAYTKEMVKAVQFYNQLYYHS